LAKRVLITAGGSGIGRAMGEAFAAAGARVWVCDRDEAALAACPPDWGRDLADVAEEAEVAALMARIAAEWGGLDVLCCNAGVAGPTARVTDVALEDWRACMAVNLEGAFLCTKHAVPLMLAGAGGAIIYTSSTAGQHGYPNRAPYAASKWGLHGLMKTVAMELGPQGIRANAICPGAVEGPRMERVLEREAAIKGTTRDAIYRGYAAGTSLQCFVTAQDVAAMAAFLGSDAAARISGQIIAVDGHTENPDPKI
jgi:NAD(P)-dependent dehydrogenase (short-subunit alcohol dehydrogenase family)